RLATTGGEAFGLVSARLTFQHQSRIQRGPGKERHAGRYHAVGVVGDRAPDREPARDIGMKVVEALEHEGAVIAELGQSGHDMRPVDHPAARDTAMALGEMNIAEEVSGGSETGCETLLLDI